MTAPFRPYTAPVTDLHARLSGRDTDTLKVNVIGCFTSPIGIQYRVLENGKFYHLNRFLLNHLRESGESCESLEIIPVEEDDE
jgi:hypothetical protein